MPRSGLEDLPVTLEEVRREIANHLSQMPKTDPFTQKTLEAAGATHVRCFPTSHTKEGQMNVTSPAGATLGATLKLPLKDEEGNYTDLPKFEARLGRHLKQMGHQTCISTEQALPKTPKRILVVSQELWVMYHAEPINSIRGGELIAAEDYFNRMKKEGVDHQKINSLRELLYGFKNPTAMDRLEDNRESGPEVKNFLRQKMAGALDHCTIRTLSVIRNEAYGTISAFKGASDVRDCISLVGTLVKDNLIDVQTSRLFLSMVRRHHRYVPTFGDISTQELALVWGPSATFPKTNCLSAVKRSDPTIRLNIGRDQSTCMVNSLREPSGASTEQIVQRSCMAAIRELTHVIRVKSKLTAPSECDGGDAELTPHVIHVKSKLTAASKCDGCDTCIAGLASSEGNPKAQEGEYHHKIPHILEIYDEACKPAVLAYMNLHVAGEKNAPNPMLAPPRHHQLIAPLEQRVKTILEKEGALVWSCDPCHAAEMAKEVLEITAASSSRGRPPSATKPDPILPSWWTVNALALNMGMIPDRLEADTIRMCDPTNDDAEMSLCSPF